MSPSSQDPDALLRALQDAAGEPPLAPLRIPDSPPSARAGIAGRAVGASRRLFVRLLNPSLAELLAQLERDRHRQRAEIERLSARVEALEQARTDRP